MSRPNSDYKEVGDLVRDKKSELCKLVKEIDDITHEVESYEEHLPEVDPNQEMSFAEKLTRERVRSLIDTRDRLYVTLQGIHAAHQISKNPKAEANQSVDEASLDRQTKRLRGSRVPTLAPLGSVAILAT